MRHTKVALAALAVLAVCFTAGTGFAAFTSSAYVNGQGQAGTEGPLVWGSEPAFGGYAANDVCNAVRTTTNSPGDTLVLTAGNLAPGDLCSYGDSLKNLGSLPAHAHEKVTSATGGLCAVLTFGDNFFSPSIVVGSGGQTGAVTHTLSAGGHIQWAGFIELASGAGNAYQGSSCTFVVTVTGSVGT